MTILGIVWIGFLYSEGTKISHTMELGVLETDSMILNFKGDGIGFYKIELPKLGDSVFVQILDSNGIISDKKIETKLAINYFEFSSNQRYTMKITNLSQEQILINSEFGDTNSDDMIVPGLMVLIGMMIIVFEFYRKLNNYKIAHPDENIS
ncbi:hypothetical protein [Nitrosopumilus sp. b1]|uniref:hypothetical protein n=1 Tax=Nitrosopumilus sp. b1 TaxID=2109907 RepID=UPI0015F3707E|nr:hypothetical protein [Nitrosopumilus sp. b1]